MKSKKKAVKKKIAALPAVRVVLKKSPRPRVKAAAKVTEPKPAESKSTQPAKPKSAAPKKSAIPKISSAKTKPAKAISARKISVSKPSAPEPVKSVAKSKPRVKAPRAETARKAVAEAVSPKVPQEEAPASSPAIREVSKFFSASAKAPTPPARKAPERIPPILFEGDQPEAASVSGPGQRYSLGPLPPSEKFAAEGELPKSYGTQRLFLAARDPHWLYAHWDLSDEQLRSWNARSRNRHLLLRIHEENVSATPVQEIDLHPESRHWFVPVDRAGVKYIAELGCYLADKTWTRVAISSATLTPPDTISADASAQFATIPFELPMEKLLSLVKEAVHENVPLAEALRDVRAEEFSNLPEFPRVEKMAAWSQPTNWSAAQDRALEKIISMDHVRRVWMGSLEITELIRRQAMQEMVMNAAAALPGLGESAPTSPSGAMPAGGAISSPSAVAQKREKGFWFNVNAELIIYGATEADATVTIAGRKIRLRLDGSFSYRFALPDGNYELPIVAISADQTDGRAAELTFSRKTEVRGEVGTHPQDPELKIPEGASL